jgi:hypothetical protein
MATANATLHHELFCMDADYMRRPSVPAPMAFPAFADYAGPLLCTNVEE